MACLHPPARYFCGWSNFPVEDRRGRRLEPRIWIGCLDCHEIITPDPQPIIEQWNRDIEEAQAKLLGKKAA